MNTPTEACLASIRDCIAAEVAAASEAYATQIDRLKQAVRESEDARAALVDRVEALLTIHGKSTEQARVDRETMHRDFQRAIEGWRARAVDAEKALAEYQDLKGYAGEGWQARALAAEKALDLARATVPAVGSG